MKVILIFLHLFFVLNCFGQTKLTDDIINNSNACRLLFAKSKQEAINYAQKDLENNLRLLFLKSGIAPIEYTTDSLFEMEFETFYYEQGCTGPDYELMKEYNFVVFNFLKTEYGNKWKKAIRKDIIGLKEWKRKVK